MILPFWVESVDAWVAFSAKSMAGEPRQRKMTSVRSDFMVVNMLFDCLDKRDHFYSVFAQYSNIDIPKFPYKGW